MTRDQAMAFLLKDGNLAVPGGRYGSDTESCAPVAYALAEIWEEASGDPITVDDLDYAMGLVVNSSDGVAELIGAYGSAEQRELIDLDEA